ncbi:ABC transporter substrate-binding protein [Paenibacillus nasutitermitis]|uniref:Ferrichrome ABC transporter substrate-binding protein n=1 Tax=Paenibacillus nasutitermitis TaxID=1652958 RepID=A0A917E130_9BACL|nr:iron-siderophore ABC transporter substrate-binding protein [Paenibacillus nasutitermitis]GGD91458.1 ferrichrome ABC transporter substrate-binding protein [Paenibacillus nasutitermitis]
MKKLLSIMAVSIVMAFIVAGCGTNNKNEAGASNNASPASPSTEANTGASGESPAPEASSPIVIKHAKGETTLDKPAQRVVVLEWIFTEDLLALGLQPVGNADNKEFAIWVTPEVPLAGDVTDVGLRWEPSMETIASLKPDLIISNTDNNAAIYDQLNAIAPTIEFDPYPDDIDQYTRTIDIFNTIATAVGKEAEADKYLADLDQYYADVKAKLAAAGKENFKYVLTQAFTSQNNALLRLFTDSSVVSQTLDRIGLVNEWKSDKFMKYGYTDSTIEALPAVEGTNFIYIVEKKDDVFANALKDNSIWKGLNFVKENRTYALDGSTWTFGGPTSSKVLVERIVEVLTK